MTSIYLLSHASQLAEFIFNLITGAEMPLRMPHTAALTSPSAYGQIIQGLHIHPDNMSTFDSYRYQQF